MSHAEASPSQVKRIILCPGSRSQVKKYSKKSSVYADEGTMLHEVTAATIDTASLDHEFETKEQKVVVEECIDYYDALIRELQLISPIASIEIEAQTSLSYLGYPEAAGHTDIKIVSENRLDIIDWKFGQGEAVYAPYNIQGMSYAAGSFKTLQDLLNCEDIRIHIVQPRLDYFSCWKTNGEEIYKWVNNVLGPGIIRSRDTNAPCIPGEEQCRWCIGSRCDTKREYNKKLASEIFKEYSASKEPIKEWYNDEQLATLLTKAKSVSSFISKLTEEIMDRCLSGEGFPGYKIVAGRSKRSWRDQQIAEDWMNDLIDDSNYDIDLDDIYITKFITAPAAEKLDKRLKKDKDFISLYYKPPGKPTLVLESDPREPLIQNASNVFQEFAKKKK